MIEWEKLKTEYVTSQISYKELCQKYGVSYSTLKIHARCDHWVEERERHLKRTMEKSLDKIGDQQAENLAKVDDLADQLLEKLQQAIEELDLTVIHHKEKGEEDCKTWEKTYDETAPGGAVDRKGLRQLAACLKDLKQIKAIQSELEKLEQEARIEALKHQTSGPGQITVVMEGKAEDYSC